MLRKISEMVLMFLLVSMLTLVFEIQLVKAKAITATDAYSTSIIQAAIDAANPGDTVYVNEGWYWGYLKISKPLRLIGEDEKWPRIQHEASFYKDEVVLVMADNVVIEGFTVDAWTSGPGFLSSGIHVNGRNVTILNNEIFGGNDVGIFINGSDNTIVGNNITRNEVDGVYVTGSHNTIVRNNITDNQQGVALENSSNVVSENYISNNDVGIAFYASSNNTIVNNDILNNWQALGLYGSRGSRGNNTFRNNRMNGNGISFDVSGEQISDFINDADSSNTVDGKPACYWVNQKDRRVPSDTGCIVLVNSTGITLQDLDLKEVLLAYTDNSLLIGNNMSNTDAWGIKLINSHNNTIAENTFLNLGGALSISGSSNNKIYHNNFILNHDDVSIDWDSSMNVWDNGYPSGGNFWTDYKGTDSNHDGIGDIPYVLDTQNLDNYPLMTRFVIPEFPSFLILPLFIVATLLAVILCRKKHIGMR